MAKRLKDVYAFEVGIIVNDVLNGSVRSELANNGADGDLPSITPGS